jgi:hypothetical protein
MMNGRMLLAISMLTLTASAHAGLGIGVGEESYRWVEQPSGNSGTPTEAGARFALFLDWTPTRDQGLLIGWRAKLYGGTVNYDTYTISTGTPVTTQTDYAGRAVDVYVFYRATHGIDYLAGVGQDVWRRSIRNGGSNQIEDYSILFGRVGLRFGTSQSKTGLHGELGAKYPFSTTEDAHLTSMGYTTNPMLSPKWEASGYAELGYRLTEKFDVVGYYDSWRFKQSENVTVTDTAGATWYVYQPTSSMDAVGIKLLYQF